MSGECFNPLSANPTKRSNTLKQFVGNLLTNFLSVFDHFVKLTLKGLTGQLRLQRLIKQIAHLLKVPFSRLELSFYISTKFSHEIKSLLTPSTQLSSQDKDHQKLKFIVYHLPPYDYRTWCYQKSNIGHIRKTILF